MAGGTYRTASWVYSQENPECGQFYKSDARFADTYVINKRTTNYRNVNCRLKDT